MSFPMIKYMLEQAIRSAKKSKTLGQMITFDFYFGLSLGQTFYNFTL